MIIPNGDLRYDNLIFRKLKLLKLSFHRFSPWIQFRDFRSQGPQRFPELDICLAELELIKPPKKITKYLHEIILNYIKL